MFRCSSNETCNLYRQSSNHNSPRSRVTMPGTSWASTLSWLRKPTSRSPTFSRMSPFAKRKRDSAQPRGKGDAKVMKSTQLLMADHEIILQALHMLRRRLPSRQGRGYLCEGENTPVNLDGIIVPLTKGDGREAAGGRSHTKRKSVRTECYKAYKEVANGSRSLLF